jgi:hypothetical protein
VRVCGAARLLREYQIQRERESASGENKVLGPKRVLRRRRCGLYRYVNEMEQKIKLVSIRFYVEKKALEDEQANSTCSAGGYLIFWC